MKMDPKQEAFVRDVSAFAQQVALRSGLSPDMVISGLGIVLAGCLGGLAVAAPDQHNERAKAVLNRLPGWIEWALLAAALPPAQTDATQH